ncbi:hypothetical protein CDAR_107741, partial [Caerostris darwini]
MGGTASKFLCSKGVVLFPECVGLNGLHSYNK